ncbi:hypothetical protein [Sporosarcina sp. ZBG7A]|uniref:hypothetical protein n=1 Tax=Sporosarcina sp. ZBG7A TaxID=1582223 RepID=UPI00057B2ADB|nr:hypothetical protein [Sporosarcina sp. ZBG7A]
MTIKDGKYPNKEDLEPKVPKQGKPAGPADELPLSDPADSNFTQEFLENEREKTGEHAPSVFKESEEKSSERNHNEKAHTEWNESKRNT